MGQPLLLMSSRSISYENRWTGTTDGLSGKISKRFLLGRDQNSNQTIAGRSNDLPRNENENKMAPDQRFDWRQPNRHTFGWRPPDAQSLPKKEEKPISKLPGYIAIGVGVSATFLWTAILTLNSTGKPGAGVDLHVAALVGLVGTAIGGCAGLLIDRVRR